MSTNIFFHDIINCLKTLLLDLTSLKMQESLENDKFLVEKTKKTA